MYDRYHTNTFKDKQMNLYYVIKDQEGDVYNGGYTYEATNYVFSEGYAVEFSSMEEVNKALETTKILEQCQYVTIETRYEA